MMDDLLRHERIGTMLASFYESLRFSAPEMIPTHLESLGSRIEALVKEAEKDGRPAEV